jgi:hypothetical protein
MLYAFLSAEGVTELQLAKERALCDQAVSTVLTTKNSFGIAACDVRRINCSITRRL